MKRRALLIGLGASLAAPALARAGSLMPIKVYYAHHVWGDGIHDDAPGINALLRGEIDVKIHSKNIKLISEKHLQIRYSHILVGSTIHAHNGCILEARDSIWTALPQAIPVLDVRNLGWAMLPDAALG